ncbi:hypothetical protein CD133_10380, partial [Staphylococcus massiliensis CCUG 55927]
LRSLKMVLNIVKLIANEMMNIAMDSLRYVIIKKMIPNIKNIFEINANILVIFALIDVHSSKLISHTFYHEIGLLNLYLHKKTGLGHKS